MAKNLALITQVRLYLELLPLMGPARDDGLTALLKAVLKELEAAND